MEHLGGMKCGKMGSCRVGSSHARLQDISKQQAPQSLLILKTDQSWFY